MSGTGGVAVRENDGASRARRGVPSFRSSARSSSSRVAVVRDVEDRPLHEVRRDSVPEDGEVVLHPADVDGRGVQDGRMVAGVADHLDPGRLCGRRCGNEQDEDQEQQKIGRSHR
jgi:hypothetical protein